MSLNILLPPLISAVGIYLAIRLRFFFILHPRLCFDSARRAGGRDFSALALALAGTLGVGNVVGVGVGILIGGAGSVFWLLVSAVFSSVIKYAEVALAQDSAREGGVGFPSLLRKSFRGCGRVLAAAFSLICLLLSLIMGAALQCSSVAECAQAMGYSRLLLLFPVLIAVALAIVGGERRIEKIVSIAIPLTTIIYIIACFFVVALNIQKLPSVILLIIESAFSTKAATAGIGGYALILALREGYSRGMLSNEAGAGTSAFAHTRTPDREPFDAGVFGIVEVLFDTVILCTLTGITVLLYSPSPVASGGAELIYSVFVGALGKWAGGALLFCIFCFAVSTVICWYYYGTVCLSELGATRFRAGYFVLYLVFCAVGVFYSGLELIFATDLLLFFLTLMVLATLMKNRERIAFITDTALKYNRKNDKGKDGAGS